MHAFEMHEQTDLVGLWTTHCNTSYVCSNSIYLLVLGCIEAVFLQVDARWKALDEIYQICIPLHLSDLNKFNSAMCCHEFW